MIITTAHVRAFCSGTLSGNRKRKLPEKKKKENGGALTVLLLSPVVARGGGKSMNMEMIQEAALQ